MSVNTNGVISWTPNDSQGPHVYQNIALVAYQPGNGLSPVASQSFTLTANFGTNTPTSVAITYPPDDAVFSAPVNVTINASASDPDDPISQVQLLAGTTLLTTLTAPPFSFVWTNAPLGSNELRAVATVLSGGSSLIITSAPVRITVSLLPPTPPVFTLSSTAYAVAENATNVVVTVLKSANSLPGSVNYATADGSAVAMTANPGDYVAVSGVLNFLSGESSKTISIPIVDDPSYEGNQQFALTLSVSGTNGSVGIPFTANITIIDDDPPGTTNSYLENINPSSVPNHAGQLRVSLLPAIGGGQWRLAWETAWRNSGDTLIGLPSANYPVEFKPVGGYATPNGTTNPVVSGSLTSVTNTYSPTGAPQNGALTVSILPTAVATHPVAGFRGQWRLQGDAIWRDSGFTYPVVPAGNQLVEFKSLSDWATPASRVVVVGADQDNATSGIYLIADASNATSPSVLQYGAATTPAAGLPNVFNGQLVSDTGYGSGCVVKRRVVLTAAHVVFDDAALSYVPNVKWFFERHAANSGATEPYEPPAQAPRGWYAFSGYSAARTNDNSPGVSSLASQNLDVAALYFSADAGRGGQSGYLVSQAGTNEWLQSGFQKTLVGYPVEVVPEVDRGRMHATYPYNVAFSVADRRVFSTTGIRGFPGMSGGPLCVQFTNNVFYPAGVYLGGSGQANVRAIDSSIADLINRAEVASYTGDNNTGGGVITIVANAAGAAGVGYVQLVLGPQAAVNAGAAWRRQGDAGYSTATNSLLPVSPTNVLVVQFKPLPGWNLPANQSVSVVAGQFVSYNGFYSVTNPIVVANASGTGLTGTTGATYRLERSPSLFQPTWLAVATNTLSSTGFNLLLPRPSTNPPTEFYRALWLNR